MKTFFCFIALAIILVGTQSVNAQQAEQKILATLQAGEDPMYYESCIPLSFTNGNLHLVTRANGQFYVYENGTRKGPYKTASGITVSGCGEESGGNNCAVIQNNNDNNYDKYVKASNDGRMLLTYNGKTYTEFTQVVQLAVSGNGSKLAAVGTNANWEPSFLTPEGKVLPMEGEPQNIILSPSGNIAIVTVKGAETKTLSSAEDQMANMQKMAEEMQAVDFSKMTPEQMEAFSKNLQSKYGIETDEGQSNNPDYYLYLNNGKKIGPYKLGGYASDNPDFNITGGENWYFLDENKLYVNGVMIKDFGDNSPSVCNTWISPDGKRYAVILGYDKLVFSDGQSFSAPLQIEAKIETGKAYLTWISLNSNKQIILYKKAL